MHLRVHALRLPAQARIAELEGERSVWVSGVEPYKADHAKLTSQINAMHLQVMRAQDVADAHAQGLQVCAFPTVLVSLNLLLTSVCVCLHV